MKKELFLFKGLCGKRGMSDYAPMMAVVMVWVGLGLWMTGYGGWVKGGSGGVSRGGSDCATCHLVDATHSHPVGVRPTMKVPGELPLRDGLVTCTTCHEQAGGDRHMAAMERGDPLLRTGYRGAAFCVQCHESGGGRNMSHGAKLSKAHFYWQDDKQKRQYQSGTHMDAMTVECLSCHDGTTARGKRAGANHPVGVAFADKMRYSSAAVKRVKLVSNARLSDKVRLFDNTVGCLSCHNMFSKNKNLVVMSNDRGQLCLSCHEMPR